MTEIKVGDKVKVVGIPNNTNLTGVYLGAVGEVIGVDIDEPQILVQFESGASWWAYSDQEEYLKWSERWGYDTFLVKKVEDDSYSVESELKVEGLSENLPYWGDGKVGDASAEAVAQGYNTIVEKGDLTVYTNLPVEIIGSIIVVGEKDEL